MLADEQRSLSFVFRGHFKFRPAKFLHLKFVSVIVLFERGLGVKTLLFSFSTADENLHAPHESVFAKLRRSLK